MLKKERSVLEEALICRQHLHAQLFAETAAMFRYCCTKGIAILEKDFQIFDGILKTWSQSHSSPEDQVGLSPGQEAGAASKPGGGEWENSLSEVARIHNALASKVEPAKPGAIRLIESEMLPVGKWRYLLGFRFMGPIIIVRLMMGVSISTLVLFLAICLLEEVNIDNLSLGLLGRLHGKDLAYNLIALLAAAGMGASFAALFELRTYISKRTYDAVYATDYWIRFFLGLASGIILAELVPVDTLIETESIAVDLAVPMLAFLGGFSVQVVYRILQRLVLTLETMIQGPPSVSETLQQVQAKEETKKSVLKVRTDILAEIGKLQKVVNKSAPAAKIKDEVDKLFEKVSALDESK